MTEHIPADELGGPLRWLADQILAWLQERCRHPGRMVAVDVLEGSAEEVGIGVAYCRRCGAININWRGGKRFVQFANTWRSPNPNLWRGK